MEPRGTPSGENVEPSRGFPTAPFFRPSARRQGVMEERESKG